MIISVLLTFAVAIVAVMFALANTDPVRIVFYGYAVEGQVGLFMLIALGIGILLGILLMLPSLVGRTITVMRTKRRISELEAKPREVKPAEVKPKSVTPPPPPAQ
jgi:putative membrane protein